MSKRVSVLVLACVLLAGSVWVLSRHSRNQARLGPVSTTSNPAERLPGEMASAATNTAKKSVVDPQSSARFEREIAPVLNAFLKRLEALSQERVLSPAHPPITADRLSSLKFMGTDSNTVSTFIVDGKHVFHYQSIRRPGIARNGITSFWNVGKDEEGLPLNLGQLTEDPVKNADHVRRLSDPNEFPPSPLEAVAVIAQRVLASVGPPDHDRYKLKEKWREQAGATALPFYTFTFLRNGILPADPGNMFRDEVMIRLKSTSNGLMLDHYQDNSIVFASTARRQ